MSRKATTLLLLLLVASLIACASGGTEEITRAKAIELARQHVDFEPGQIEAIQEVEEGRPVWRVTFYGEGVSAGRPGQVQFVVLDRKTGEVVSLGMS